MRTQFVSFDGTERCAGDLRRPDRYQELRFALREPGPHAVRGAGLSYCLASAGDGIQSVSTGSFGRLINFDRDRLLLRVEPGLTVGDLVRFCVERDCYFPVLPGHPAITVGGCAGFNIHGKTQHNLGNFFDHVESLTLIHPDHDDLVCSREQNDGLFALTVGGMGLTGYIADITLRLQPLRGRSVRRSVHSVVSLIDAVDRMESLRDQCDVLYSWNDLNRSGARFGSGLVFEESFEPGERPNRISYRALSAEGRGSTRFAAASKLTTMLLNAGYRAKERLRGDTITSVEDAAFPINGSEIYFKLFGRRGFREYQMLFPRAAWSMAARDLERLIDRSGVSVTLGSLKLFAGDPHLLWFCADGVCLTINAAADERTQDLFGQLDRLALDYLALVNVSKDSRLTAETARAIFPGFENFKDRLVTFDPLRRFDSTLRRRLDV